MRRKIVCTFMAIGLIIGATTGCSDNSKATAEDAKNLKGIRDGSTKLDPKGTVPGTDLNQKLPPP